MKIKNSFLVMFFLAMLMGVTSGISFAEVVNVGNKICPVSGEAIDSMGESFKVEHEGKEYNLCCKMCVKDFEKNPEKYIKIVEAEVAAQSAHEGHDMGHMSEKKENAEKSGDHGDHDHQH